MINSLNRRKAINKRYLLFGCFFCVKNGAISTMMRERYGDYMKQKYGKIIGKLFIGVLSLCILIDVKAYATEYEYDKLNRLVKTTYEDGSYVTYEYDANGNIVNTKNYEADNTDPQDPDDDPGEKDDDPIVNPPKETSRETNEKGQTTKIVYEDGSYTTFQYDQSGKVTKTEKFDKDGNKIDVPADDNSDDDNNNGDNGNTGDSEEEKEDDKEDETPIEKVITAIQKVFDNIWKSIKGFFKKIFG